MKVFSICLRIYSYNVLSSTNKETVACVLRTAMFSSGFLDNIMQRTRFIEKSGVVRK